MEINVCLIEKLKEFENKLLDKKIIISFNLHQNLTINSLIEYLNKRGKYGLYNYDINKIIDLLLYDFSEYNIAQRLQEIKNLNKDSSSKRSFLIRYGEIEGEKRYLKRVEQQKITNTKEYIINKFGEEKGTLILKSKCPNNLNTLIEKYGEEDGNKKYNEYLKNYKHGNTLDGYIEKYGEEDGNEKYNERQEKYIYVNTKQYYIDKWGEAEGLYKWNDKNQKNSYKKSKQYYVDTYGEEGILIFKDHTWYGNMRRKYGNEWFNKFLNEKTKRSQGISIKQKFIKAYGEEEGNKKYEVYILKQKYAHTIEYYIEKNGEEKGKEEYLKTRQRLIYNFLNKKSISNISLELFKNLKESLNDQTIKFANKKENNKEFFIFDEHFNKLSFYDFFYNNKIIEFHGDFWHMDPFKYNENDINIVSKLTAKEIWEHDEYKYKLAKNNNYDIKIIWEHDYRNNKNKILQECLKFLKNE